MPEEQAPQAQATLGRDVFISYASQDKAIAEEVCAALERHAVRCWIAPRDVTPGDFYADSIVRALDAARIITLILSENSVTSPHVLREVERASAKRHPVISLRIDQARLPPGFEYFLNTSQWLDASDGETRRALPKLIEAVQRQLASPSVTVLTKAGDAAPAPLGSPPGILTRSLAYPRLTRLAIVLSVGIAVCLAYIAATTSWLSKQTLIGRPVTVTAGPASALPVISEKSIAVLPFVDMSEKKDQEYFADGLSEELIDKLTRVPGLRVPARTSSFYFKGKQATIADMAHSLGVVHLLEGSVRKSGNTLRITAQLIRADNGYHLWSNTYDRNLNDIFKIQDEIAGAVVKELQITLMTGSIPKTGGTANTQALILTMQAKAMWASADTKGDSEKIVEYVQRSLKLDPTYALTWVMLSKVRGWQAAAAWIPVDQGWNDSRRAAERALALDPALPAAHNAMAQFHLAHDWDWSAAESQIRESLALDPNNAAAIEMTGVHSWYMGDLNNAISFMRRANDIDPLYSQGWFQIGVVYSVAGRYAEAQDAFHRALEIDPNRPGGHSQLGLLLVAKGDPAAGLLEIDRETDEQIRHGSRALAFHALGRKVDADSTLADYEEKYAAIDAFGIAEIHAYRGEVDQAFRWLDRAYSQRDSSCPVVKTDPFLKNLKSDPRFGAFLSKMNLPK